MEREELTPQRIKDEYERGVRFNEQINLYDTVKVNEDFFVGKQWEGVNSNGLPTPVFNVVKRIILHKVATTATDNVAMAATPMNEAYPEMPGEGGGTDVEALCRVAGAQLDALLEQNNITKLLRGFIRDGAVRGDGCIYSWFDPSAETGQEAKGTIRAELIENTRVIFGDPTVGDVESQPYIIISRRERVADVKKEAKANGMDPEALQQDEDETGDRFARLVDGKVTTLTRFEKREGTVWWCKATGDGMIQGEKDTGLKGYPIAWMSWERVSGSYHGQAEVTGLIPNQIFINKTFAMVGLSLLTTAYPKVIYDMDAIPKWDNRVGAAIGVRVSGRDLNSVAKIMDPGTISPQVSQFIQLAEEMTKELTGATDAALGNVRPENTSAIIALQKASGVPMELVKQELYRAVEDMGRIWLDMMRVYYGKRYVALPVSEEERRSAEAMGLPAPEGTAPALFDFAALENTPLGLKLDVGGSAYWSEITQINTLENLLGGGYITPAEFLERMPNGYIPKQQELIDRLRADEAAAKAVKMAADQEAAAQMAAAPAMTMA